MSSEPRRRPLRAVCVVAIAGSDSSAGAGVQADLLTFAAHGVYGATVVVAGTAQNTRGVIAIEPFSPGFVRKQIDAVFTDLRPAAVKIGMLYDAGHVRAVAAALREHRARNVVLDPVLAAKGGVALLTPRGVVALRRDLLPLCDLVTPNLDEAAALSGIEVRTDAGRRRAAIRIGELGPRAVLVKGGHAPGRRIRDILWTGRRFRTWDHPRVVTDATHGTGCTLSSAVAANLARGQSVEEAVGRAIRYVRRALSRGVFPGAGIGVPGRLPRGLTARGRSDNRTTSKPSPRSRSVRRRGNRRGRGRGSSPSP